MKDYIKIYIKTLTKIIKENQNNELQLRILFYVYLLNKTKFIINTILDFLKLLNNHENIGCVIKIESTDECINVINKIEHSQQLKNWTYDIKLGDKPKCNVIIKNKYFKKKKNN